MYDISMNTEQNLTEFESLAATCKALAHPARLAILKTLAGHGSCICGEIVDVMPLSQATVSQHLKVLREAGWISGMTEGPATSYCLDEEAIAWFRTQVAEIL